jgi:hypothetical protein
MADEEIASSPERLLADQQALFGLSTNKKSLSMICSLLCRIQPGRNELSVPAGRERQLRQRRFYRC